MLQDLPSGVAFKMSKKSRIVLVKGERMKKKYCCTDINTGRLYLVHEGAVVIPINKSK